MRFKLPEYKNSAVTHNVWVEQYTLLVKCMYGINLTQWTKDLFWKLALCLMDNIQKLSVSYHIEEKSRKAGSDVIWWRTS